MSNNNPPPAPDYLPPAVPDSEALKAKYAEIAALKRAIEEKKMNQYSHSPVPSWYGGRGGFRGAFRGGFRGSTRGGVRAGYGRGNVHRNMTLVFEPTAANSSTANEPNTNNNNINNNNSEVAYISTTNTGSMSLINSSIYEQESKARQQNFEAALNSKEALRISNLEKGFQRKIQIRKAKTENFDRVRINKEIFAVTHGGMTLVLIGSSQGGLYDEDQKVVYWNNLPYIRIENGDLMCHVNRGRVKSPVDCSFFGSTGTY